MQLLPRRRPRAGFAVLDLLFAVTLVAFGALAVAGPLTQALASLDAARRAQRRSQQLMHAVEELADRARRGECAAATIPLGAVAVRRWSAPPGVQVEAQLHDSAGPPRRRRTEVLQVWLPCGAAPLPPTGAP